MTDQTIPRDSMGPVVTASGAPTAATVAMLTGRWPDADEPCADCGHPFGAHEVTDDEPGPCWYEERDAERDGWAGCACITYGAVPDGVEVIESVTGEPVTCDICGQVELSSDEWDGEAGVHLSCRLPEDVTDDEPAILGGNPGAYRTGIGMEPDGDWVGAFADLVLRDIGMTGGLARAELETRVSDPDGSWAEVSIELIPVDARRIAAALSRWADEAEKAIEVRP